MASRQGLVLLKNDLTLGLPFPLGKKLAVIGPDSNSIQSIMQPSNYNSNNICPSGHRSATKHKHQAEEDGKIRAGVDFSCLDTLWDGLNKTNAAAGGSSTLLTAAAGGKWDNASIAAAVALAQAADNVIVFVSNAEIEGGEGHDRASIALPADQIALAAAVFAAIKGKPAVRSAMLTINGGVMAGRNPTFATENLLENTGGFAPSVFSWGRQPAASYLC